MARVEDSIEVSVPVGTAYDQWTQFEEFPNFMEGVKRVEQLDNRRLRWTSEVAGREKQWEAEIKEQVPDRKIIWSSVDGDENAGIVEFEMLAPDRTRVNLQMSYDPDGFVESAGDALGFVKRRVHGDLERFRDFIEERGVETGAYRGMLRNEKAPTGHTQGRP